MSDTPRHATGVSLRSLSIKRKLMLITMSTSTVALLLASVGFVVYDLVAFRSQMSDDLMTQAEIVGANSMAALAFRDGPAAREILVGPEGQGRDCRRGVCTRQTVRSWRTIAATHSAGRVPARPDRERVAIRGQLPARVPSDRAARADLGTVYIESDMQQWDERLKRYTGIVGVLMFGAAIVALLLSSWLQRMISAPDSGAGGDHAERLGAAELRAARGEDQRRRDGCADRRVQRHARRDSEARYGAAGRQR